MRLIIRTGFPRIGVTIDQVTTALTNNSANVGGGVIEVGDEVMVVRSLGIFNRIDDIAQVIVLAKNGRTVLVSDVAEVTIGNRPLSGMVAFNNDDNVVEGVAQMSKIWLTVSLPPSSSLENTRKIEHQVRAILRAFPEVGNVISHVGRLDDGTDAKGQNNMEILADLKPHGNWRYSDKESLTAAIPARIRTIPGVPTNFSQVIADNVEEALSGVKGEIAVKIAGPDLDVLRQKSEQVAAILAALPGAADVAAVTLGGQSEFDVAIDRMRNTRLGVNVADINNAMQTALAGATVNTYYEGDLAKITMRQGASRISREGGERNVSIKANLLGRDQGSFVAQAQQEVAAQVHLQPGYVMSWGGQFENQQRAVKRLRTIIPVTTLLIFSLLFWTFRSVRKAFLVLSNVPRPASQSSRVPLTVPWHAYARFS